jgi:hypothetical protein
MHGHLNVSSNFLPCRKQVLEEFYVIRFRALIIKTKKNAKKLYTLIQFFFYNYGKRTSTCFNSLCGSCSGNVNQYLNST